MTVPLILRTGMVARFDKSQRSRDPHVAMVYATADGRLEMLDDGRPIGLSDQLNRRFRRWYEIDMGDHHRTLELRTSPPPAQGGIYHFETQVNVGFRVTDPVQVVRRNIVDGLKVVADYLMANLRDITAAFPVEAAKDAEDAVNNRFRHGVTIGGCIEVYLCRARLRPDPEAAAYIRRAQGARWDNQAKEAEHDRDVEDARRANTISLIQQSGSLDKRARERDALGGRPVSMQDLVAMHLENNPDDTEAMLKMVAEIEADNATRGREQDKVYWERMRYLMDQNLLSQDELGRLQEQIAHGMSPSAPGGGRSTEGNGRRDLPPPLEHEAVTIGPSAPPSGAHLPGLIPVYLVVDESPAMSAGIEALNNGLRSLSRAVTAQPDVAEVVRLALVSYSDRATLRMGPQAVDGSARLPTFTVGPGPARLTSVFELLAESLPDDVVALKRETTSLRRPQVILINGGAPADGLSWTAAHRRLVDRSTQPSAPEIIACGVGAASQEVIVGIATRPEFAFFAPTDDLTAAVQCFWEFAARRVIEYGRAVLDGDQSPFLAGPRGFRPASRPSPSPANGE